MGAHEALPCDTVRRTRAGRGRPPPDIAQRGLTILSTGAINIDQIETQELDDTHVVLPYAFRTSYPMLNQKDGTVGLNLSDEARIELDSAMGSIYATYQQQATIAHGRWASTHPCAWSRTSSTCRR